MLCSCREDTHVSHDVVTQALMPCHMAVMCTALPILSLLSFQPVGVCTIQAYI